jgi:hypothetical protein
MDTSKISKSAHLAECSSGGKIVIIGGQHIQIINEANASLIAEAFNVANESGFSPAELLKQRDYLLAALALASTYVDKKIHGQGESIENEDYTFIMNAIQQTKKTRGMKQILIGVCVIGWIAILASAVKGVRCGNHADTIRAYQDSAAMFHRVVNEHRKTDTACWTCRIKETYSLTCKHKE